MTEFCLTSHATDLLRDVERAYAVREKVDNLEPVLRLSKVNPYEVFRSHLLAPNDEITGKDLEWRAELDLLLGALSALHAGGLEARIPRGQHKPDGLFIWELLCHPAVSAYYEKHYPLAPPLLVRAAGEGSLPDKYRQLWQKELDQKGFVDAYRQFLHLDARFIANDVIGHFIELMDDFYVFDTHISEFRDVLQQPALLRLWLDRPDRWQLLEGMASFYEFALDLDRYLATVTFPMLRGHVWLHFAYWFGNGGVRMQEVALWLKAGIALAPAQDSVGDIGLADALQRLRNPHFYPLALIEQTAGVLGPWLQSTGVGIQLGTNDLT